MTIVYLPRYVRLVRASALGELNKDYVTAAKVAGVERVVMVVPSPGGVARRSASPMRSTLRGGAQG